MKPYFFLFAVMLLFFSSCSQEEGIGGSSHIKGVLIEKYYNNDMSVFQYESPAKDEDIFIVFGEDSYVGENTSTNFTGDFQFQYLWPGDYKLYYYSDDTTSNSSIDLEVVHNISLAKNETLLLNTLYTYKKLDYNDGQASIKGKVQLINYKDGDLPDLVVKDITPAQEVDVYLVYNNESYFSERIKTMDDGTFEFRNLIKGSYKIFVYSEDVVNGATNDKVLSQTVEITDIDQEIELTTFVTEKI